MQKPETVEYVGRRRNGSKRSYESIDMLMGVAIIVSLTAILVILTR